MINLDNIDFDKGLKKMQELVIDLNRKIQNKRTAADRIYAEATAIEQVMWDLEKAIRDGETAYRHEALATGIEEANADANEVMGSALHKDLHPLRICAYCQTESSNAICPDCGSPFVGRAENPRLAEYKPVDESKVAQNEGPMPR